MTTASRSAPPPQIGIRNTVETNKNEIVSMITGLN